MTQTPADMYDSYEAAGLREDISDLIFNISPTETPALSAMGTTTAGQRYHQWQTDVLEDPVEDNAKWEGEDASFAEPTATEVLGNYTQISTKVISVTGTLEVTEKYGRDSEVAYLAAKNARELKTDVDKSICSNNASAGATNAALRMSAGLAAWLETNISLDATSGANGGFSAGIVAARTDSSAQRSLSQALVDTVIQSAWTNGGKPSMLLMGPVQKTALSGFDGVGGAATVGDSSTQSTRSDRATRTIYATADLYVSNFGELRVVPSRHIRDDNTAGLDQDVFLLDPEYLKIAYLRPWQQFDIAKTGDSIKREMLVEWTLELCNEKAHGGIFDLD